MVSECYTGESSSCSGEDGSSSSSEGEEISPVQVGGTENTKITRNLWSILTTLKSKILFENNSDWPWKIFYRLLYGFLKESKLKIVKFCWIFKINKFCDKWEIILKKNNGIRCTSWFNAGSRIIGNNLCGCFFLFLAPAGGSNPAGPSPNLFPHPGPGKANIYST